MRRFILTLGATVALVVVTVAPAAATVLEVPPKLVDPGVCSELIGPPKTVEVDAPPGDNLAIVALCQNALPPIIKK